VIFTFPIAPPTIVPVAIKLELVAAMLGMVPETSWGLLMTVVGALWCTIDDCVAMDEVEFDRVGDEGRAAKKELLVVAEGASKGAAIPFWPLEGVRW
jgi:hypothetical protein